MKINIKRQMKLKMKAKKVMNNMKGIKVKKR